MKARIALINKYAGAYVVIFPNGERIECANYATARYYVKEYNRPLEASCLR